MHPDGEPRQDVRVVVDEVDGVEHRLQALDPLLSLDPPTHLAAAAHALLVHGEEPPEHDLALRGDLVRRGGHRVELAGQELIGGRH